LCPAVIAIVALLPLPVAATEADDSSHLGSDETLAHLSLSELGDVEVTSASKTPETLRRVPAAIHIITQEDIRRSGATSLPEVLRLAPGVEVARIDSDHWSVGVRGFGDQFSKSVLVLVDGRNVYTPLFAGIYWGAQNVLLEDIDRIEVIRGPGGTIWGANAANGVINIITKDAQETRGSLATIGAGNVDRGIVGVRQGGGDASFAYRVYANGFGREPEAHTDGHAFDAWHMGQAGYRVDWIRSADQVTMQGDLYKATEGQSVVFGSFAPVSDVTSYDPVDLAGGNLLAKWRHTLAEGDVQVQAYYDRTSIVGPQLVEARNTLDVDFVHHRKLPRHDLRWGLGVRWSPSRFTQTVPSLDLASHETTDSIYSAFVQDEIALAVKRLSLTVGVKVEHNNYTGAESQPSARLLWTPTERHTFWAGVTRAVRTPSLLETDLRLDRFLIATPPTYLQVLGNAGFRVERNVGYEGGYRATAGDRLFVDVSAFHNRHDDVESFGNPSVVVETTPAPVHRLFVLPYENGVAGTSNGMEVAPDWKPLRWLQLKGSYSYLTIDVHNTPGVNDILNVVSTYEGSSPRHQMLLQPILTLPGGWEIDQTVRHISALPGRSVTAYTTLDARIGRTITRHLDVFVVGQNLLQAEHVEFGHDPGPVVAIRRAVFLSATLRR
jgi:iron complex outermembrane receptor protein